MYTVYVIFAAIIVLSFITGNVILFTEHKAQKKEIVPKPKIIIDEEII